ncbi:MAG: NfeD family protein [Desulfurococcales archaeon]|jgi:membrane protein implicated in regulation of membrane protease activity|nr:NfeD family protein [Desulfurococcales archaeon]
MRIKAMKLTEITLAILDDLLVVGILLLAPVVIAYKINIVGLEEVLVIALILLAVAAFIIYKVVEVHRREVKVGIETYIGRKATVVEVSGSRLIILVEGELWNAECENCEAVKPGDRVLITGFHEGRFRVRPLSSG